MTDYDLMSDHYLRAARVAFESGSTRGYFPIALSATTGGIFRAWQAFSEMFELRYDEARFETPEHCVMSLLLMSEMCKDRESLTEHVVASLHHWPPRAESDSHNKDRNP